MKRASQITDWTTHYDFFCKCSSNPSHLSEETYAIVSSRITNAFLKVDIKSGDIKWIAGGDNGQMRLTDPKRTKHPQLPFLAALLRPS